MHTLHYILCIGISASFYTIIKFNNILFQEIDQFYISSAGNPIGNVFDKSTMHVQEILLKHHVYCDRKVDIKSRL